MAKRFIDTDLFRKPFMRSLEAPYKALWIYLLCECDHAGVWVVELDVAQIRMGLKLDPEKVIEKMQGAVVSIDGGSKWYLPDFVAFQYGSLNRANRVHASVIDRLQSLGINPFETIENKPLTSPLQGAKDKDKDKDKDTQGEEERAKPEPKVIPLPFTSEAFAMSWAAFDQMRKAKRKPMTERARALIIADLIKMGEPVAIQQLDLSTRNGWTDVYWPKPAQATGTHGLNMARPELNATRRDLKTTWD